MSKPQPFEINWVASAGSALGAVSAAVLLSTLGAAGTLIGAALGSLIITVGGSIYTQSLQKTTAHVQSKFVGRQSVPANADMGMSPIIVEERTGSTSVEPPKKSLRNLPWKRIVVVAIGLFVAVMAIILAFELATGRPVSSFTGGSSNTNTGTTFSGLGSGNENPEAPDTQQPDGEATITEQPTAEPTMSEGPTEEAPTDAPTTQGPTSEKPVEEKPADPPPAEEKPVDPPPAEEKPVDPPPAEAEPVDPPQVADPPANTDE